MWREIWIFQINCIKIQRNGGKVRNWDLDYWSYFQLVVVKAFWVPLTIANLSIGRSNLRSSAMPSKQSRNSSLSRTSAKYLWKKLKSELNACVKQEQVTNPVNHATLVTLLTQMGFLGGSTDLQGQEHMVSRTMKVIKMSKSVAADVYDAHEESLTTLDSVRALLAALCGISGKKDTLGNINDNSTWDTKLTKFLGKVSADIPGTESSNTHTLRKREISPNRETNL